MSEKYKDIDYTIQNVGPHYIDPKFKKPGFFYCLVGNLPGQVEYYQRLGYEVVKDEDIKIGQEKPSNSHALGAAVTVQSKCGQLMVLMKLPNELKEKLDKHIENAVKEKNASMGHISGIPIEHQYGDIIYDKNKL
jgi:hypothetical protein